jgi:hypothetical protein
MGWACILSRSDFKSELETGATPVPRNMQRFFIIAANCALLVALLGVPEIAGVRFWHWQISSIAVAQTLMFWGLALAAGTNAVAALFLFNGRKERQLCRLWVAVFGALLLAYWAFVRGWFNFDWLQRALLWLQKHL